MPIETTLAHIVLFICAVVGGLLSLVLTLDVLETKVDVQAELEVGSAVGVLDRAHVDRGSMIFWVCVVLAVLFLLVAATGRSWANFILIGYAGLFGVLAARRTRRSSRFKVTSSKLPAEDSELKEDGHGGRRVFGFVSLLLHVVFLVIAVMGI